MVIKATSLFACSITLTGLLAGQLSASEIPANSASNQKSKGANVAATKVSPSLKPSQPKTPQSREAIRQKALFHTTRREFTEAVALWSKLAQKPDAQAEAYLGWSQLQIGDKSEALKHINRSIALNPRSVEGYRYLGYYLIGEGKVPEAVKAFRTSMSFDPHHKCNCGDLEKLVLSKSKARKL
ncbi:MAG TPA: tetratricopeptide repeat protein [Candidatus Melainabacteria bacterium]|nr:tetratricopeptide repeat protein [Candidatus Melainabacteria bacterium]